jgi:hypothetical protein
MIVSKYSKSYDTADGTEQQFKDPDRRGKQSGGRSIEQRSATTPGQRWEDDGGSLPVQPPVLPTELPSKPAWSVLSLIDLNEAIRLEHWPDNPVHLRRRAEETERLRLHALEVEEERMATFAHAQRHRHRNHWENT